MANIFPLLSSGSMRSIQAPLSGNAIAMFPATLASSFVTRVIKFVDDSEQRWIVRGKLFSANLQYKGVNGYDMSLIRAFFNSMNGMFVSTDLTHTFQITIDNVTYDYCTFGNDDLMVETDRGDYNSFELNIVQVAPNGATG